MKKTKTLKSKRSKLTKIIPEPRCKKNTGEWDEKYLNILKALPDIIYRIDQRGRFTFISTAVEALGFRADELIGKHFSAILHPADVKKTGRKYVLPKYKGKTTGDDHAPKLFDERRTGKRKTQGLEIRLKTKREKELIYAEVIALGDVSATGHYNRPTNDKTKKFLGTLGVIRDITSRKRVEAKLHYQADMLRHVSDAIISTDLNLNIRTWNQAAEKMYGWKFTEIQGKAFYKLTKSKFPHDKQDDVIKQLFKRGKWNGEVIQQTKNGNIITVHASCVLMKDYSDNPSGVVVVNRDITKLKRTQNELRQSEEKYRGIFDAAPDGIITVNRKGIITTINKSYCKRTGYSKNEIIGKHISKIPTVPVKDIPGYLTLFKSILKGKTPEPFEYKCIHKNGSAGWSEVHASIMKEDGKEMGFQAVVRDITKRKQAEKALLESEERFRQFFENSPEYCYMIAVDSTILDVNKTALKALEYRKEELVGKSLGIIYAPESQSKMVNLFNAWKKTGVLRNKELKIISKSGKVRTVLLSANAVKEKNGTPLYTISVQKDITDQKEAQDALIESEKKYSAVVENSLDAIIIHQNRIIKFVNRATMQQTGYSENDFINKDIIQFIAPAYKEIVVERSAARSKGQNVPSVYTIEVVGKNGKNIPVEISVSAMQYMGNPATLVLFRNISDRRKAETMLKQSEEKYRLLSENIPVAVYSALPDKHLTTLFVSNQIYTLTGYKPQEFLGDPKLWWNIIHPNDRASVRQTWSKVKKKRTRIDIEYRIITKTKKTKWLCERAAPLFYKRKTIVQYNGYREDITQRKIVQEQLSRSEARYRNIVENTGVGVATTNIKGEFTFVNKRLCRMIGYSKKDIINKPFIQFLHPDDRKQTMDIFLNGFKNPTRHLDLEFRVVHKNGGTLHMYSSPTLKLIEGEIVGFSAIIQDITRLKKTEEEIKQRNEELAILNRLSAVISQTLDLKEILGTAIDKLLEIIHLNVGGIYLYDATNMTLKLIAARGLSRKHMHAYGKIQLDQRTLNYANKMARRNRFLIPESTLPGILQRLPSIIRAANKEKLNPNHITVFLLHAKKHLEGLLLTASETNFKLDKKRQRLLESIIQQITVAILNAKLYETSKHEINERVKSEMQIKHSLKEKEALLREIHHRVKNNLQIISSLLNLQAGHISDEYHRNIFKESQNRIRSMVLVHEKLYQSMDLTRVQTQTYLESLLHHLFQSYGVKAGSIKLELETQNILLNVDTAIPCGLIINELVSNSLKYAFKISRDRMPMIRVTLSKNKNSLMQLCVSDNGIGIPDTINTATSSTLGLQLVHALVEQLHGTITIDRSEGTSFTITCKSK